jgi:hypothetical protein
MQHTNKAQSLRTLFLWLKRCYVRQTLNIGSQADDTRHLVNQQRIQWALQHILGTTSAQERKESITIQ